MFVHCWLVGWFVCHNFIKRAGKLYFHAGAFGFNCFGELNKKPSFYADIPLILSYSFTYIYVSTIDALFTARSTYIQVCKSLQSSNCTNNLRSFDIDISISKETVSTIRTNFYKQLFTHSVRESLAFICNESGIPLII